ncbi:MAG: FAD-binding oxidoreductase [Solirubrobacterales bacterium]|nr:FAD-binding oxidoreductase [Solirubrobacterales bacterium]
MATSPYADKGLWHATYGEYEPSPPLAGSVEADVAIVGGGFTGMATAYWLLKAEPSLKVVVLESEVVGYGASGRNGSFAMTVVGLGLDLLAKIKGRDRAIQAQRYLERAVDLVGELVETEGLDCDYIRPGFLRMATTPAYEKKIRHEIEFARSLGIEGIEWLDRDEARARVNSAQYRGAWWEPRMALVNPLKLVREMKRVVTGLGATVHEGTPVEAIERPGRFRLRGPNGTVNAERIVLATNAYSHLLMPEIRGKQVPAWTYVIATEPLSEERLAPVGWDGFEGVEDARNLIHYYRRTPDNRILMGGGPVGFGYGRDMDRDANPKAWRHLEDHITTLFPDLAGVKIDYRWGGPFSVTTDLTPAIGYIGDPRAVYSVGCIGHGVAMTHLNGQTIRDLLLERRTELTEHFFVNRRVVPWPPEPLRYGASLAIRGYLQMEDRYRER